MKALTWIITTTLLMTMLAYIVARERPVACEPLQLSQVLR